MKLRKIICILLTTLLLLMAGCSQTPEEDVTWYMKEDIRTFFGAQTTRYVYEYNDDWSTGSITTYENGEMLGTITYEHTETGYITRGIQDGVEDVMEVVITRDDAGNAVHTEQYLNGQLSSSADSTFDKNGNMLTYHTHVVEPDLYLKQETEYDSNGNKIKLTVDNGYMVTVTGIHLQQPGPSCKGIQSQFQFPDRVHLLRRRQAGNRPDLRRKRGADQQAGQHLR